MPLSVCPREAYVNVSKRAAPLKPIQAKLVPIEAVEGLLCFFLKRKVGTIIYNKISQNAIGIKIDT